MTFDPKEEARQLAKAQVVSNLAKGRQVQNERWDLKRAVKDGTKSLAEVMLNPPDYVMRMTVEQLLKLQPYWGTEVINKVCGSIELNPSRYMEELTHRQRHYIALWLRRANILKEANKLDDEILALRDTFVLHRKRGGN